MCFEWPFDRFQLLGDFGSISFIFLVAYNTRELSDKALSWSVRLLNTRQFRYPQGSC